MYKIFLSILAGIIFVVSVCISFLKPQMHKPLMLYNSDYQIEVKEENVKVNEDIPQKTNTPKVTAKVTTKVTYNSNTPKIIEPKNETVVVKNTQNPLLNLLKEDAKTSTVTQTSEVKNELTQVVKTLTEEEKARQEEILWNEWRSNLQNSIMQDVRLPIVPEGTIFKFSFNVDKYGKITNVQTWSLSPAYNPYAIQYIAPVIRSYQGHDILNFPAGSNRFSTLVEGGWRISKTTKYSTPEDFSDTEKILNRY